MRASPVLQLVRPEISRFPCKERAYMPGSTTTPGRPSACVDALGHVAFRYTDSVGTRDKFSIAAQWLACTYPCRRFADTSRMHRARLGADVVRYSFIAVDLHPLLLAGLPAHLCENPLRVECDEMSSLQIALGAIFSTSPRVKRPPKFLSGGVFTQARPTAVHTRIGIDADVSFDRASPRPFDSRLEPRITATRKTFSSNALPGPREKGFH